MPVLYQDIEWIKHGRNTAEGRWASLIVAHAAEKGET